MAPLRGLWIQERAVARLCATRQWRTLTFLGGLRFDQLTATGVFDGPINDACPHIGTPSEAFCPPNSASTLLMPDTHQKVKTL
jgi:hypothetical protein